MIQVYGSSNCARCEIIKRKLGEKGVEFEYHDVNKMAEAEVNDLVKKTNSTTLPFIIKDEQPITFEEVLQLCK